MTTTEIGHEGSSDDDGSNEDDDGNDDNEATAGAQGAAPVDDRTGNRRSGDGASGNVADGTTDTVAGPGAAGEDGDGGHGARGGDGSGHDDAGRDRVGRAAAPLDELTTGDRRRLRRAWAVATAPVLVAYTWVLTVGSWDLLQSQYFDDFFDVQARAMFDGRLDVPPQTVGFEGFLIGGKTYIYFGPVPSLLRMPVLAVTDSLDGRLTTLSMLLAMLVLSVGAFRLSCLLRGFVRGSAPVGRKEPLATAGLAVATLAGPPFFLASEAVVYHEASIWGLALAVLALDSVGRWALRPTGWRLMGTTLLITAAVLSRQSLGLAPLVALALVCATYLWRHARSGPGPWWARLDRQALFVLGVAIALPGLAAVGVNYAKFGTLLTPPSSAHVQSMLFERRQEVLEENDGSLFGLRFAPTTLAQYVRPDGIDVRRDFPWIDFPRFGPSLVGDSEFDELDWSSSIPASAPALTAGATVTAVHAWRARRRRRAARAREGDEPRDDPVLPPMRARWLPSLWLGTVAGASGVIAFGYIANRYLNDLFPTVLVPGVVGFHLVVARGVGWSAARRRLAAGALAVLALFGGVVNLALALAYQRERGPVVMEEWRAEWVRWRVNLPGAYSPYLVNETWRVMPRDSDVFDGRLAVVGDCTAMYLHRDGRWVGVERGPGVDVYDVVVDLDDVPDDGRRVPLMSLGRRDFVSIVALVRLDDETVRVDVARSPRHGSAWEQGTPVELSGEVTLRIDADTREVPTGVSHGRMIVNGTPIDNDDASDHLGRAPEGRGVATRFPGHLRVDPVDRAACRDAMSLVDYNDNGFPIVEG